MFARVRHVRLRLINRTTGHPGRSQGSAVPTSRSYQELLTAFQEAGCPVCNLLLRDADRYLDSFLYELALNDNAQRALRARRGLCNEHSRQAVSYMGRAVSLATLYSAVLEEVLQIIEDTPVDECPRPRFARLWGENDETVSVLAERLAPTGPCVVCDLLSQTEQRYLDVLQQHISDPCLQESYRVSDGLCLPHFQLLLRAIPDSSVRVLLATMQKAIWQQLRADVDEYLAKSNYLRIREPMGEEGDSWRRAVLRMGGEEGVFGPDPR